MLRKAQILQKSTLQEFKHKTYLFAILIIGQVVVLTQESFMHNYTCFVNF